MTRYAWLLTMPLFLGACGSAPPAPDRGALVAVRPAKLSATGYGTTSSHEGYTPAQRRLMAMRASKLDAYRALVEQVYGVRITSSSTVAALVAQHDSFRAYVDAYVRGARVLTVTPMADGEYETVLELELGEPFYRAMAQPVPVTTGGAPTCAGGAGSVGSGCSYGATFYYAE